VKHSENLDLKKIEVKEVVLLAILAILIIGLLFYANYTFAQLQPGGTDFLYRWMPVRLLLFEQYQNPYSVEVSQQVQLFRYGGRLAQPDEVPCLFAYPYYIIPFYVPFALIKDYPTARAAWMTVLELIQMSLVLLTIRLLKIHLRKTTIGLLLAFSLFFSFFTQPLVDGNPSPISALFTLLCLFALAKGKDWQAGLFLALATIKPQLALLFFVLIWIWAFSNKRWKILLSSGIGLVFLVGVSFLLQPGWFSGFVSQGVLYQEIASPHSPQTILKTWLPEGSRWISLGLSTGVAIILCKEWAEILKKDFIYLFWVASLTFTLLPLSGITSAKSNFIAILPGFVLFIAMLAARWEKGSKWINSLLICLLILSWSLNIYGLETNFENVTLKFIDFLIVPICFAAALYGMKGRLQSVHIQDE